MEKAKKTQQHGKMREAMFALEDIFETYPMIAPKKVTTFSPIYYPIAIVEMKLLEETFENFEAIQLTILKLIHNEIVDYRIIAKTLGLSAKYCFNVIRLLMGFGHVDEQGITALGIRSLERGEKITYHEVWQKFQLDALNGTLLRVEELIVENMMDDKDESNLWVGHLNYLDGIEQTELEKQLLALKYERYIQQKSGVLNVNVTDIRGVKFIEIKYAKAYVLELEDIDEPLIFGKKYNANVKEFSQRFSWGVLSLEKSSTKTYLNIQEEIPKSSTLAKMYGEKILHLIKGTQKTSDLENEVKQSLRGIYPFNEEGIHFISSADDDRVVVLIDERGFSKFRTWILQFLYHINRYGEYLMTDNWLSGNLVSLRANSEEIVEVGELLSRKIQDHGKKPVFERVKKKIYSFNEDTSMINKIHEVLLEL